MPKKILVVDDEEILTKTFARLLEKSGYDVLIAKNGQDALETIQEASFDLILCDIRMPGINGTALIRQIKEFCEKNKVNCPPYIFITGYTDELTETAAKALNPVAYINKPFDNIVLLEKIKSCLVN